METAEAQKLRLTEYDRIGGAALRGAGIEFSELGVNDYATHLDQYLRDGEAALDFIEEDLITDSAERMVRAKYIHEVNFLRHGNDFLSVKGNFSMRRMAANTQDRMTANKADWKLQKRAEIEAAETDKLDRWFQAAGTDEVFEIDSLPIAEDEEYAVKRIYSKTGSNMLAMHVVILHSPSLTVFNEYRADSDVPAATSELAILDNYRVSVLRPDQSVEAFIEQDVNKYDSVLARRNPGQQFVFGIPVETAKEIPDSNDIIRHQKPLLNIYKDTVRALGDGRWQATPAVVEIDQQLGLGLGFKVGQPLNLDQSRSMLDGVHQYIMSTLNNAPEETLEMLAALDGHDGSAAYGIAGHYGAEAAAAGLRYESSACPTVININSNAEQAAAERAFRLNHDPTKCVMCPGCKTTVDLPKELYKQGILHCVECKLTVKNGKVINHKELFKNPKEKNISGLEIIADWFRKDALERRAKKQAEKQAVAELGARVTYLDKKRYERQARKELGLAA